MANLSSGIVTHRIGKTFSDSEKTAENTNENKSKLTPNRMIRRT